MESPLDAQRRLSAIDNPRGESISFRREIYLHRRRGDRARRRRVVSDCRKPILAAAEHRTKHELSTAPKRPTDRPDRDLGPTSIIDLWAYYNCDTSTIRLRFDYDSATTRYNTLRGFSFARIRDRIRESVVGVSCMLIDSSMHTAFTLYLYRPTLHRVCEYARNCLYKSN